MLHTFSGAGLVGKRALPLTLNPAVGVQEASLHDWEDELAAPQSHATDSGRIDDLQASNGCDIPDDAGRLPAAAPAQRVSATEILCERISAVNLQTLVSCGNEVLDQVRASSDAPTACLVRENAGDQAHLLQLTAPQRPVFPPLSLCRVRLQAAPLLAL